jgi:type II secretory ATPase GspE/PulE/Tfp pilus assembly ATPase PilB-like protein
VRQVMALEAVVEGVAAQRLVAEMHEHVDEPDDERARDNDTQRTDARPSPTPQADGTGRRSLVLRASASENGGDEGDPARRDRF